MREEIRQQFSTASGKCPSVQMDTKMSWEVEKH